MAQKTFGKVPSLVTMPCNWSVGPFMEKFYAELKNKKLMGTRCPKCGTVYVPPRSICGSCWKNLNQWVQLQDRGELVNFTVAHVDHRGGALPSPRVLGMIRLAGQPKSLPIFGEVKGVAPDQVKIGMSLAAVWAENPAGELSDLSHFVPAPAEAKAKAPAPRAKAKKKVVTKKAAKKKAPRKVIKKKVVGRKKAVRKTRPAKRTKPGKRSKVVKKKVSRKKARKSKR